MIFAWITAYLHCDFSLIRSDISTGVYVEQVFKCELNEVDKGQLLSMTVPYKQTKNANPSLENEPQVFIQKRNNSLLPTDFNLFA